MGAVPATTRARRKGHDRGTWWTRWFVLPAVLICALAACGQTEEVAPEPTTLPATGAATASAPDAAPPPAVESEPATAETSPVTFGALADRVNAAWATVRTYRAVFDASTPATPRLATPAASSERPIAATPVGTAPGSIATPVAASPFVVVREVVLPDRQRQTLAGTAGDDHEAVVVSGMLYLRGPLAQELLPTADDTAWLSLPLAELPLESEAGHILAGLTVPPASPLAGLREGLRPQELRDLGPVEVEGRICTAYAGADTSAIGTRQDITVAVDGDDLPCSIETRVGTDLVSRIVYTGFNQPIAIEPPAAATPVAGLLPDATPMGRD